MGCANSAKLTEEVQVLQNELESAKQSLIVANELKEAFSQELEKRRQPESAPHQRTEDASQSDSQREEWLKVKDWIHTELSTGRELFLYLLTLADLHDDCSEARDMQRRLQRLEETNYDTDLLVDFSLTRARSLKALAEKVADERRQLQLHLKAVEEQLNSLLASFAGQRAANELQEKLASFRDEQSIEKLKAVSTLRCVACESQHDCDPSRLKKLEERLDELRRCDESKARELNAKNVLIRHLEIQLKEHSRSDFDARLKQLEMETRGKDLEIAHLREQLLKIAADIEARKMLEAEVSQVKLALHIATTSHTSGNQEEWLQSQLLETQVLMRSLEAELALASEALQRKDAKLAHTEARLRELGRQKVRIEDEVRALETQAGGDRVSRVKRMIKDFSGSIEKGLSN